MRLLFLCGIHCKKEIWRYIQTYFNKYETDYVEYPHTVTSNAITVNDITKWVYKTYSSHCYDAVIAHSLGGIIALQLASAYQMHFKKIILLDTNLKPANAFYRNLMTDKNFKTYGKETEKMLHEESVFYRNELLESIQYNFDFTNLLTEIPQKVYAVYGDRGKPDYPDKIKDLNLSKEVINRLHIAFIENSCHMIMIENPSSLADTILNIIQN